MSIQGEINYAHRVEMSHLETKPFTDPRAFREFTLALELVRTHASGGSLLDLGCGPGWTSILFSRAGYAVTAVDIAPRMIDILEQQAAHQNVSVDAVVANVSQLDLANKSFDAAVFFDSLHHFPDYADALAAAGRHLAPGGVIVLFEPSWLHRISPHARRAAEHYDVTELGFSRRQLRRALQDAGFEGVRQHHDPGALYSGALGFARALVRVTADYVTAYPRLKRIVTARKPVPGGA